MRLNQVTFSDAKPVDGYGPGFSASAVMCSKAPF